MTFLQPVMLWGLAAAALPILIHLLNRLRYRTVHWGAMLFLLQLTRNATKRSRIRHYLILACRTLALLALPLALARPFIGGWLGNLGGRAPEVVIILFDRSVSMEHAIRPSVSRREQALAVLVAVPPARIQGSRIILIDSAHATPREIATTTALPDLAWTQPTDTAADWPRLLDRALDWIESNRPGRTEIWIATDAQASNWRQPSAAWQLLQDRISTIPAPLTIRMLLAGSLAPTPEGNVSIQAQPARLHPHNGVTLPYLMQATNARETPLDAALLTQEGRTLLPLQALATATEGQARYPAPDTTGWAGIELPPDTFAGDNTAWYVFAPPENGRIRVYAEQDGMGARVEHAFRPARAVDQHPATRWLDREDLQPLADTALVVWQGAPPTGHTAAALQSYIQEGGVVLALPPADAAPESTADAIWSWRAQEPHPQGQAWTIVNWENTRGPLARTSSSDDLPLAGLATYQRRTFAMPSANITFKHAFYQDQEVAFWRANAGAGCVYALGTLPLSDWSEMADGRIWIPMLWRMRAEGAARLGHAQQGIAGIWAPATEQETWESVAPAPNRNPHIHAGIYRSGQRLLALNRPPEEDDTTHLSTAELQALLPNIRMQISALTASDDNASATDVTLALLFLAAVFLILEAYLCLGLHDRHQIPPAPREVPA